MMSFQEFKQELRKNIEFPISKNNLFSKKNCSSLYNLIIKDNDTNQYYFYYKKMKYNFEKKSSI